MELKPASGIRHPAVNPQPAPHTESIYYIAPKTNHMATIFLVIFYLTFPIFILFLCNRFPVINKVGGVVIAYVAGFIIGNTGLLPLTGDHDSTLELLTTITVPLAIPLMLFSLDIRKWRKMAGKSMLSMMLGLVAVSVTVLAGFFIFRKSGVKEMHDVAGMMVGLYTGSTPNLAAIQLALNADLANYMIIVTYDLVIGAVHLLFVMTIAQRLFNRFLPRYHFLEILPGAGNNREPDEPYMGLLRRELRVPLAAAFGIAVLIFGIGGGVSLLIPESSQLAVVILIITTLGIVASLIPAVNRIERSFELGMYLIMVFCLVIASRADLWNLELKVFVIAGYVLLVVFGSIIIQALLSRIFKVDTDTFLVTSTALICNPAIVPVVAGALRNREVVFSGLWVGIFGLAIGNYLGIFIAWLLEKL